MLKFDIIFIMHKTLEKKIPNWQKIIRGMQDISGWRLVEDKPDRKVFVRGREKIIALEIKRNKWKAEYLINNRLFDSSGVMDPETLRIIIAEMAIMRDGGRFLF